MDEVLSGGITNAGAVFRRGEIVDRPAQPHAPAIHRFLKALPEHGFTGAPKPVGLSDGREQLTYVAGDVAVDDRCGADVGRRAPSAIPPGIVGA